MDLRDAFSLTGASIRTHKLRSILAAIGVVLGIGSVIGVVTMGAGFQQSITGQFTSQFSADLIAVSVTPNGTVVNGPPGEATVFAFTDRDVDAVAKLPGVKETSASRSVQGAQVRLDGRDLPGILVSAGRGTLQFSGLDAGHGRQGPDDAVVSNRTALHLMAALNRSDVLGTTLEVVYLTAQGGYAHSNVTVVGVEKPSSFGGEETMSVDGRFAQPDASGTRAWGGLVVRAQDAAQVATAKASVKSYLDAQSDAKDRKGDRLVFRYDTQEGVIKLISSAIGGFTAFIGALGAVALLVGLVGIANIMLVSVQERTREIGVMKATGATRGEILLVFLVESVAICVVGAILGIGLGMLMGLGLDTAIGSFSTPRSVIPFVLVWSWYGIAVALGVLTGIVAGLYPAWRAGKVSPVEALRYE
jgi:putative ABC transport system permease protein